MKYLFMLLIFLYVILYSVIYKCAYLTRESPVGTVRFQLQQPTAINSGTPCDPTDNACDDAFTPLEELDYCSQNKNVDPKIWKWPCTYWDANQDVYMTQSALLMTTRVAQYNQTRQCGDTSMTCSKLWKNDLPLVEGKTSLIADIEKYTLLLDHTVVAPSINVSASARGCTGYLKVTRDALDWKELCLRSEAVQPEDMDHFIYGGTPAQCFIKPNTTYDSKTHNATGLDVFDVNVMLRVAGIDLNGKSPTNGRPIRYNGAQMAVNIRYQNWAHWLGTSLSAAKYIHRSKFYHPCSIPYEYELSSVLDTASKRNNAFYTDYPDHRAMLNEHGIQLFILQTGSLAGVSMAALLIAITSSLTLLAVSTTLVDTLAIYVLPEKKYYSRFKYPETPHVSELVQQETRRKSLDSAAIAAMNGSLVSYFWYAYIFFLLSFLLTFHIYLLQDDPLLNSTSMSRA